MAPRRWPALADGRGGGPLTPRRPIWLLALALALAGLGRPTAAQPRVGLAPVLDGLLAPLQVTHARDGSGRLFVLEQGGRILVRRPAAPAATLFLDLTPKVLTGGERGLLGLAFHPQFAVNRRFFVNYTRRPDGATVIAEHRASAADPDTGDPAETVLLAVPQPFANHNGGMLEFGPDGFLYIGLGDGGSGGDPGDRAQDPGDLLGKLLRIDVDTPSDLGPYAAPPGNPFAGSGLGRPEVFALGFRNPWRFAFDRLTGRLLVGDVGEAAREEVSDVVVGGNYGWRVLEGTRCTGLGPAACDGAFVRPIAEYTHAGGRCAITGGYVYRGPRGTLAAGTYVFADLCSGEIFALAPEGASPAGARQTVLLATDLPIASFGEDEEGELYVVSLAGQVFRLVRLDVPAVAATLYVDGLLIRPGDLVRLSVRLENAGPGLAGDVYLGALLPDGVTAVLLTGLAPTAAVTVRLDGDPQRFVPVAANVPLASGLDLLVADVLRATYTGAELPPGLVRFFVAVGRAGTRLDLLSAHVVPVSFEP